MEEIVAQYLGESGGRKRKRRKGEVEEVVVEGEKEEEAEKRKEEALGRLKQLVKSDSTGSRAIELAGTLLGWGSSSAASLSLALLDLMDVFFVRSKEFRKAFCEHELFQKRLILQCLLNKGGSGEFASNGKKKSASLSSLEVSRVREKLLSLLAKWDSDFGEFIPTLRVEVRHLRDDIGLRFPASIAEEEKKKQPDDVKNQRLLYAKFTRTKKEMGVSSSSSSSSSPSDDICEKIHNILDETERYFLILVPDLFSDSKFLQRKRRKRRSENKAEINDTSITAEANDDDDDVQWDSDLENNHDEKEDLEHALSTLPDDYEIVVSIAPSLEFEGESSNGAEEENAVKTALAENVQILNTKFLPILDDWISILGQIDFAALEKAGVVSSLQAQHEKIEAQNMQEEAAELRDALQDALHRGDKLHTKRQKERGSAAPFIVTVED